MTQLPEQVANHKDLSVGQKVSFSIPRLDLLKVLKKMSIVINKSTVLPILECVLFRISPDGQLEISGTDLETHISKGLSVELRSELTKEELFCIDIDNLKRLLSN